MKKTVLLGISGGIAAIKIPSLIQLLRTSGCTVIPVMTRHACQIVSPQEVQRASGHAVFTELFGKGFDVRTILKTRQIDHIAIADQADVAVVAPTTANILAKLAHGIADDILSTTLLAVTCPVLLYPSMNVHMWNHQIVQDNIRRLKEYGYIVLEPASGMLACGYEGAGRLPEVATIHAAIQSLLALARDLHGKTILITSGGTVEPIDDVRFITNKSSGKMGAALADACVQRGAAVIFLKSKSAVVPRMPVEIHEFETAAELESLLYIHVKKCDICFHAAAVSDFTAPFTPGKRSSSRPITLLFKPRPKIYRHLKSINPRLKLFLFKAEYRKPDEMLVKIARNVIGSTHVDGVIANDVGRPGRGFAVDTNEVILILSDGTAYGLPFATKQDIANKIIGLTLLQETNGAKKIS